MRHQACENTKCNRSVSIIHLEQSFPTQVLSFPQFFQLLDVTHGNRQCHQNLLLNIFAELEVFTLDQWVEERKSIILPKCKIC